MWKEQPLTGFGLKSFRIKCWEILNKNPLKKGQKGSKYACGNHPHNYYFEFLSEAGLIGTILLIIFFLILMNKSFHCIIKYNKEKNLEMFLMVPVVIIIFLEIWPLRSTGSFFTNWNATFFWLNAALLVAARTKKL